MRAGERVLDHRAVDEGDRRHLIWICGAIAAVIVAYWIAWFAHRSLVASASGAVYVDFEQAFPLADGFIVLFLLLGASAGFYLGGMDVLFDLEHGIWSRGANGLVELVINIVTFGASAYFSRWVWSHRRALDPPSGEPEDAGR